MIRASATSRPERFEECLWKFTFSTTLERSEVFVPDTSSMKGDAIVATATAVRSETRTDEDLQRDVLAELKWDARVQPNEIGVSVMAVSEGGR